MFKGLFRFKLLLPSLVVVIVVIAVKLSVHYILGFTGYIKFSDIGVLLGAGVFFSSILVNGVMADFKESEKIPANMCGNLENIYDVLTLVGSDSKYQDNSEIDCAAAKKSLRSIASHLLSYIYQEMSSKELLSEINDSQKPVTSQMYKSGIAAPVVMKVQNEFQALRGSVTRLGVIADTGFIPAGYAILEVIITLTIASLFITTFDTNFTEVFITAFVTLLYTYIYLLIKDLDNPFEYEKGKRGGCAEVDIRVIESCVQSLSLRE
ncbi:MAG: hypothetical protein HGB23_04380 [Chlorobiaceae bacterium]|nr:hypothetical protein [Chlorobiaceae bacterium]